MSGERQSSTGSDYPVMGTRATDTAVMMPTNESVTSSLVRHPSYAMET